MKFQELQVQLNEMFRARDYINDMYINKGSKLSADEAIRFHLALYHIQQSIREIETDINNYLFSAYKRVS